MDHIADIWLINPHPKGNRCHHHNIRLTHKAILADGAVVLIFSSMIGNGIYTALLKMLCHLICFSAREAIDDTALPLPV